MALPVIHLDRAQQAAFTGWAGEVSIYADLPVATSVAGEFWMVLNPTGSRFLLNYKAAGLYLSEAGVWRKINDAQILLNDNQFAVYNAVDNSKQIAFDVSTIATATKRTATWPDKDGTVAMISDVGAGKNFGSSQWSKASPVTSLPDGNSANGMTFFTSADKITSGTTSYDEYDIHYGIGLTLTGTSGTANISINGTPYLATFNTDLATTASDWVTLHTAAAHSAGVHITYSGGALISFGCTSAASCNSVAIATVSGDLSGTRLNRFTGLNTAAPDHILIPYVGTPYEGQRLQHKFRVNFGIVTAGDAKVQAMGLSLKRYADDTIIGSETKVSRDDDVEGVMINFITYTATASDPFVTGGFYFSLRNGSGVAMEIVGPVGVYIETTYQMPTVFL